MTSPLVRAVVAVVGALLFTSVALTRRTTVRRLRAAGRPVPAAYRVMTVCWVVVIVLTVVVVVIALLPTGR